MATGRKQGLLALVLLVLVLTITGCGSAPNVGGNNSGNNNGGDNNNGGNNTVTWNLQDEYKVGRTWTYNVTDNGVTPAETWTETMTVVGHETFNGQDALRVDVASTDPTVPGTGSVYYTFGPTTMKLIGIKMTNDPDAGELLYSGSQDFPTVFASNTDYHSTASYSFTDNSIPDEPYTFTTQLDTTVHVGSITTENVTVPAGTYAATKIPTRETTVTTMTVEPPIPDMPSMDPTTDETDSVSWYKQGIGMVKNVAGDQTMVLTKVED